MGYMFDLILKALFLVSKKGLVKVPEGRNIRCSAMWLLICSIWFIYAKEIMFFYNRSGCWVVAAKDINL